MSDQISYVKINEIDAKRGAVSDLRTNFWTAQKVLTIVVLAIFFGGGCILL